MTNDLFRLVETNPRPRRAARTTIDIYLKTSRQVARHERSPWPYVLGRMIYTRMACGLGAEFYESRRIHEKPLEAIHDFISVEERDSYHHRLNPEGNRLTAEDKLAFASACLHRNVPTVRNYALILLGQPYAENTDVVRTVRNASDLGELLRALPDDDYILKPIDTAHGWGVTLVSKAGEKLRTGSGRELSPSDVYSACQNQPFTKVGFLLQERLRAHPDLKTIMPGPGLGAFRCISLIGPDGTVEIPWAALKIPGKGVITDNFSRGLTGTLAALIDVSTGQILTSYGRTAAVPITATVEHHPETGARIIGFHVPRWNEMIAAVQHAARAFSITPSVGWDIALTDRGPVLLEMNWFWGHDLLEVASNRGLRSEMVALFTRYLDLYARCSPDKAATPSG